MTKQAEDKVMYEGNEYYITYEFALEEYMHKNFDIPPLTIGEYTYSTTACNRGYFAEFEIRDDNLYIHTLNGKVYNQLVEYTGGLSLISGYEVVDQGINNTLELREKYEMRLYFDNGKIVEKEKL